MKCQHCICHYIHSFLLGKIVINILKAINAVPIETWRILGMLLGLQPDTVSEMFTEHANDFIALKTSLITAWLNTGSATWIDLVNALKDDLVRQNAIANKIIEIYIQSPLITDVD